MIISHEKVQRRIHQACLFESEKDRISALCGAEAARAESLVRLAGIFFLVRQPNVKPAFAAALEHAQHISRLRDLPTRNRIDQTEKTFLAPLVFGGCLQ